MTAEREIVAGRIYGPEMSDVDGTGAFGQQRGPCRSNVEPSNLSDLPPHVL